MSLTIIPVKQHSLYKNKLRGQGVNSGRFQPPKQTPPKMKDGLWCTCPADKQETGGISIITCVSFFGSSGYFHTSAQ